MRRLLVLSLLSVVAVGAGVVACAADADEAGLNPQPLPPDDKKETESPGLSDDRGASGSSSGATNEAPPTPPNSTFISERFIALHMMAVRMMPDAPTRAPVMIRA